MTDYSGSIFRADRAKAVYETSGIEKHAIESGAPWRSYPESAFNTQRWMADWHVAEARSWPGRKSDYSSGLSRSLGAAGRPRPKRRLAMRIRKQTIAPAIAAAAPR